MRFSPDISTWYDLLESVLPSSSTATTKKVVLKDKHGDWISWRPIQTLKTNQKMETTTSIRKDDATKTSIERGAKSVKGHQSVVCGRPKESIIRRCGSSIWLSILENNGVVVPASGKYSREPFGPSVFLLAGSLRSTDRQGRNNNKLGAL